MNRRKFLKAASGLFLPAAPAIILPRALRAQIGLPFPGPGTPHSAGGGPIVPAHVQSALHSNGATPSLTCVVSLPAPVSLNGTVCLSFGTSNASITSALVGVADDKANSYATGWIATNSVEGFEWDSVFLTGITNGPQTFTITWNFSFGFSSAVVDEYSGVLATSALDGTPSDANQNSLAAGSNISSGTTTPTSNGCLIYSSIVNISGSGAVSAGSGFTQDQAGTNLYVVQHQVQAAAAAIAGTGSHTATDSFTTGVYALKHA